MESTFYKISFLSVLLFVCFFPSKSVYGQPKDRPAYLDTSLPIPDRVVDLIDQMTLDEKMMQIQSLWIQKTGILNDIGHFDPEIAGALLDEGIGHIARPGDDAGGNVFSLTPVETAELTNAIQTYLLTKTRLGVPALFHAECLHGFQGNEATNFPIPLAMASTWNLDLVEDIYSATASEAKAVGIQVGFSPVLDVCRDPRWGRTEETFGEDSYLVGEMGMAAIYGLQGREDYIGENRVMATLKHFAGHGQPESGNNTGPANYSERVLREVFLAPFQKAIESGRIWSIMASHNEIDGVPSHGNTWLLEEILRNEWQFEGTVVSDYYGVKELKTRHRVVPGNTEAAALALGVGIDLELPDPEYFPELLFAFETGELPIEMLDQAVARILTQKMNLGLFENPFVDVSAVKKMMNSKANQKVALQAAEEAIILLKNANNLAPLSLGDYKKIAVIGPNGDKEMLGAYFGEPINHITVFEGIKNKVGGKAEVMLAEGCRISEPGLRMDDEILPADKDKNMERIEEAVELAEMADIVILALGGNELTSRETLSDEHLGDRSNLQMAGLQDDLVDAIHATGKPIVAVLLNGRPLAVNNLKEKADCIFECWYLGEKGGEAIANVLFGKVNPSGKLPISIPRSVGHLPAYYNHKPTARRGYLWEQAGPLWPFGFGMSYTNFEISKLFLQYKSIKIDQGIEVAMKVKNTGSRDGAEVIQVYVRDVVSSVTRPVKELKGFKKVFVPKGEEQIVTIYLEPSAFSFYDSKMEYVTEPGLFEILIGTSSDDKDLQSLFLQVSD